MLVTMATGVTTVADDAAIVANIHAHRSPMRRPVDVFHVKQKSAVGLPLLSKN